MLCKHEMNVTVMLHVRYLNVTKKVFKNNYMEKDNVDQLLVYLDEIDYT